MMHLSTIETPALVLDVAQLERNIATMAAYFSAAPADLRPHFKTHKSPLIAHMQLAAGAIGMTCAKLGEAEQLVLAGVRDILIANQVVAPAKLDRLAGLAHHATLTIAVDAPDNVRALGAAARAAGSTIGVVVEVDVGMGRCGVLPGEPTLDLARLVSQTRGLRLAGVMGYEGHAVLVADRAARTAAALAAMTALTQTADFVRAARLEVSIVTGGGTGTYDISSQVAGMTEIEAGSYATMDARYATLGLPFGQALFLHATVISRPTAQRVILDAGMKAITHEFGLPPVTDLAGARLLSLSEEHGTLELSQPDAAPAVGDVVRLIPSHGCTTINLHERYYAIRGEHMDGIWPIAGRGKTQ